MHIVGQGNVPEPLEEAEIAAVRRLVARGVRVGPWPYCKAGQLVEVVAGPMTGLRGTYIRTKSEDRLIVSLPLLQRSVATEIESYNVRLVAPGYHLAGAA